MLCGNVSVYSFPSLLQLSWCPEITLFMLWSFATPLSLSSGRSVWDREMGKKCLCVLVGCCGCRASVIVTATYILSQTHTIANGGQAETTEVFIMFMKACVRFLIIRPFKSPPVLVMTFF